METVAAFIGIALLVTGCAAAKRVENKANDICAAKGKKAFLFNTSSEHVVPLLYDYASAEVLCVGPDDATHMPAIFGADAVSSSMLNGVGIVAVAPGLIADKAGLKPGDLVYEFTGRSVTKSAELQSAIEQMPAGDQAVIKLRRKNQEMTITAHF